MFMINLECSVDPITGWSRNGKCEYYIKDKGMHLVCGRISDKFLNFTFGKGKTIFIR